MMDISIIEVSRLLAEQGYFAKGVIKIAEGSNHHVFDVKLKDGNNVIVKFARRRYTEMGLMKENIDTMYGGRLSLEREAYLYELAKNSTGLPVPRVYGTYSSEFGDFIIVEKMSGITFNEYLEKVNYSIDAFVKSMYALGRDLARVQNVNFKAFGNIMEGGVIEPEGMTNFSDRFRRVIEMHLSMATMKGALTDDELCEVRNCFLNKFEYLRDEFDITKSTPVLVFSDLIPSNFFVDEKGVPTGYFDIESSQAAPAALEFYGLYFYLFNMFDHNSFLKAEEAFYKGYSNNGGRFAPRTGKDMEKIELLSACRLLELTESYWGYIDGIRDTWGIRIKNLMFDYMKTGKVDYLALGDIFRERDLQPKRPSL